MTYSLLQYIDNIPKLDKKQREKFDKISKERARVDRKKVAVEVLLDGWQKCTYLVTNKQIKEAGGIEAFKQAKMEDYRLNEGRAHNIRSNKIE